MTEREALHGVQGVRSTICVAVVTAGLALSASRERNAQREIVEVYEDLSYPSPMPQAVNAVRALIRRGPMSGNICARRSPL